MTDVVFHIDEDARWDQLLSNLEVLLRELR